MLRDHFEHDTDQVFVQKIKYQHLSMEENRFEPQYY